MALIAGGVGITPIRALLEDMPGDIAVVYRASRREDMQMRAELDELARRRGADLHYVIGAAPVGRAAARARARPAGARRVRLRPPAMTEAMRDSLGRTGVPRRQVSVERFAFTLRRAVVALVLTAVAVVLLARYETAPPVTRSADDRRKPPAIPGPAPAPRSVSAVGPALVTPFSAIQVKASVKDGRLVGVETVALSGDGPHTDGLNAAEPILRERALRAGSADVDVVTGATSTSEIWIESLQGAIRKARRAG